MEQQMRFVKQMIDFQRVAVDGMISNMIVFWDQTGNMMNSVLNQAAWLPEEGKKAFREWVDSNRKGCETLKTAVCNGYDNVEKCFAGAQKQQ